MEDNTWVKPYASKIKEVNAKPRVLCTRYGLRNKFINTTTSHVGEKVSVKAIERESWMSCENHNTNKGRTR